ncbi:S-adenosylmethionine:tRNA ribosyltransferase-isomerase [Prolixibacter bellariivorans]|uniref:S-adenosylmethionine:tRNA ribosyltransferase-isomerase n=1 Tax=Prolixibacter bellariivorans TaxID=314319 RepID=A0A5M4B0P9_9BACT|nr:S-adenosylmethionine:tRNA ribosyltransferase-isomerase [Prolixibacter bellariivorans]GET33740.1 S-adenosylmethionine:tRNA ribosyltransferase-isomerase [Prolixibacter bellariivorans]
MVQAKNLQNISVQEFTYELPDERIAKYPLEERDQSQLLIWNRGEISDDTFRNLSAHLPENSLLVFNNTRVIRARLHFRKQTGARIEIFCLEPTTPADYALSFTQTERCRWKCIVGNLKKWKGEILEETLELDNQPVKFRAERIGEAGNAQEIEFSWDNLTFTFSELLEATGNIPIPPYLHRESEESDLTRYQTVYSRIKGSVAAPTAGLHFTERVFDSLSGKNIERAELTLHVGAGTFQPVKSDTIGGHEMHTEHILVEKTFIEKLRDKLDSVIAVGTTSIRTLESLYWIGKKLTENPDLSEKELLVAQWEPYQEENHLPSPEEALSAVIDYLASNNMDKLNTATQIIILPGYEFRIVRGMITNFHQPQSTLLLLISAFLGDDWKRVYQHALDSNYRFLSYGDSNLYIK